MRHTIYICVLLYCIIIAKCFKGFRKETIGIQAAWEKLTSSEENADASEAQSCQTKKKLAIKVELSFP
jgi:hypothetical protein